MFFKCYCCNEEKSNKRGALCPDCQREVDPPSEQPTPFVFARPQDSCNGLVMEIIKNSDADGERSKLWEKLGLTGKGDPSHCIHASESGKKRNRQRWEMMRNIFDRFDGDIGTQSIIHHNILEKYRYDCKTGTETSK